MTSLLKVENQQTDQYEYFEDNKEGLEAATRLMMKWASSLLEWRRGVTGSRKMYPEVFIHRLQVGKKDDMINSDQEFAEECV